MKSLVRLFFKTLRAILGPILLFLDWLTSPRPMSRDPEAQRETDSRTAALKLYHFRTCPFCIKVRREIRRLSLNIETRDAQHDNEHREALLQHGGQIKVPCLRILNGSGEDTWLYESDQIISYLREHFAS
jgi:glutaredoxin